MTDVKKFKSTDQRMYRNLKWYQTTQNTVFRPLQQKNIATFSDIAQVSSRVHRERAKDLYSKQVVINGIRARSPVIRYTESRLFQMTASLKAANEVQSSYHRATSIQSKLDSVKLNTGLSLSSFRGGTVLSKKRNKIVSEASGTAETFIQLPSLQKDKPNSKFRHTKSRLYDSKIEMSQEPQHLTTRPPQFQKFAKAPQITSSKEIHREMPRAYLTNTQLSLKQDTEPTAKLSADELKFLNSDRGRSRLSILNDLNNLFM